ncbi:hypothetical protein Pst134EA_022608 [Puccinia striiformis f. sp. tritici]|uniref:hypothetical protein n=1 Tax=Puccinia striiformis f. sp. tritici TaxID=168172 RepID=UPI0020075F42|nr:hypothetical protein Pst134EA_022608 [Puccinia striiformis f. sp. tritici]KAH9455132.1 hypothetical protein Pst134EA_022608 [Puccinia striiformis f. sp. tritici]
MSSSPLTSTLSTPPKAKAEEVPGGEDLEEEQEEIEEEQDEEELDDEEAEEIEEEEDLEDKSRRGVVKGHQAEQLNSQPIQPDTDQPPPPKIQHRTKKIHSKKVVGTTILPVTRVTRAAKQDKDIKIVSKEAVFLISIATVRLLLLLFTLIWLSLYINQFENISFLLFFHQEYFVKKLTDSAFERAKRERRVFVKYNDVASAVKRNPEYDWLEEVIPATIPLGTILQNPMIPSSSTAITNRLPTETLMKLNESTSKQPSIPALLNDNNNIGSMDTDSHPTNLKLPPVVDDGMDLDDQDELDEEF